ncbi:DNA-directed RNA polymerase subunit H [Ignicoccus hospitalis]|uniref:DNA-directed RNA polymerase subunit H n=1 Tax=Ignicoccus hospitalis TaxID=160233 RepID=UPI000696FFA6|nr:DNA-directed RNA polymerase subunit H [Ignicoccus hospitalis]HIH90103.1 DNA-directed RNA polymerase subunit H [Desulfurococcaceae archaeon]
MAGKKKFSVLDHVLVPQHVKLSPEEAVEELRKWGLRVEQLPLLKASDPVARELDLKPGDIVKIIRKSENAEEVVVFRYVVAG